MKHPPLLFLDCETLGLDVAAPIWEVAMIRVTPFDGEPTTEIAFSTFVEHEPGDWVKTLPESFRIDYETRYPTEQPMTAEEILKEIAFTASGKAIVVGSNPQFDMTRIEQLAIDVDMPTPPWHYHAIDMPTMVHGYLLGKGISPAPPWKSDLLSQMVGVDPTDFDRHTALGDVQWCLAMWKAITQ